MEDRGMQSIRQWSSTYRYFSHVTPTLVPILIFLSSTNDALAQQRFRATPLVKIDFTPAPDSDGTIGINQKGQVVYGYVPSGGGNKRAWIWLPANDASYVSGYNTAGVHELSISGIATPTVARDVNETGDVVGQGNGLGETANSYGTVWRLASSATPSTIGNLGGSGPWSSAHAISDHSTPKVAGDSKASRNCTCSGSLPNQPVVRGFYMELGSSLVELDPGNETYSYARDIAKVSGQSSFYIGGFGRCASSNGMACEFAVTNCNELFDAKFWNNSTTPTDMTKLTSNDAHARGVNVNGGSVGSSFTSGLNCRRHAVYWASSASSPVDLHDNLLSSGEASRAEAVNNLSNPQVVGWNETSSRALLWEYNGSSWSVLDLQSADAIGNQGGSTPQFDLRQAHDINDDGWIVCWGFCDYGLGDPLTGTYVVLLTPFDGPETCPEDLNEDGVVNVIDLLILINGWGSCIGGPICGVEDINTDALVDVVDLLILIEGWGLCTEDGDPPASVEDCQEDCANHYPGYGQDYTDCVEDCVEALCRLGTLPPEDCPD
jgi:hypothetical protein